MNKLSNIISYLSQCYIADNRETGILHFFGSKVEKVKIVSDVYGILSSEIDKHPIVDKEYAQDIMKAVQLYKKEKDLVLGALFVTGCFKENNKKICAPLFLYPAELKKDTFLDEEPGFFLTIQHEKVKINTQLIREICNVFDNNAYDFLLQKLSVGPLHTEHTISVKKLFDKLGELNTSNLDLYPKLFNQKELNSLRKNPDLHISPVCTLGLIKKSVDTRGVLHELKLLSNHDDYSGPIQEIFGNEPPVFHNKINTGMVPSILSKAQQNVIEAAEKHTYSVIFGPPGTGKTYTISSLAIEQLSKGRSILIACRTDEALDVVQEKINKELHIKNTTVRAGMKEHLRKLKGHIKNLLNGMYDAELQIDIPLQKQKKVLLNTESAIDKIEEKIHKRIETDILRSNFLFYNNNKKDLFASIKKRYYSYLQLKKPLHYDYVMQYEKLLDEYVQQMSKYISDVFKLRIRKVLSQGRKELKHFLQSLKARTGSKQDEELSKFDFNVLLQTFPIWLIKISDISKVLPQQKELFDIAIIDEATQCDMASLLPVLQRAKKAVLAGDPHQLKHISFLSSKRQQLISQKIQNDDSLCKQFDYRNESILEHVLMRVDKHEQINFLNEHFRSIASIISFSNEFFYENKLFVMTEKPLENKEHGVKLIQLHGKRETNGINQEEVRAVIQKLKDIIQAEKPLKQSFCSTIGVLSPFRAQKDELAVQISIELSVDEIEKHNILVGTAYSFQGQERDIMILSFTVDNESHHSAFIHLNKPDVFNVSITRAKKKQFVFHSLNNALLQSKYLVKKFLNKYADSEHQNNTDYLSLPVKDSFLSEVKDVLQQNNYKIWPGIYIAGQVIDILVQKNGRFLGIDLIGFPGAFEDAFTLDRYKMLKRAQLDVFPLSYIDWKLRKEECIHKIVSLYM